MIEEQEIPEWASGIVVVEIKKQLPLIDRIKIFLGGKMRITVYIACENDPGKTEQTFEIKHVQTKTGTRIC